MKIILESVEDADEFCKRWKVQSPNIVTNIIPKQKTSEKPKANPKPKTTKKQASNVKKSEFIEFPLHTQKKYDLKWNLPNRNEDWWTLRYKNGQGYKKFDCNLLVLCFLKTFNGKIQENEVKKYSKKFGMSETRLKKIIWNLKVGTFDKYFKVVENEIKKVKVNVLRNNTLLINNRETEITSIEAKGLLFSIQNAPNRAREVLKQYKQFEHKLQLKEYFLLCWNYNNPEILNTIRFGGV